MAVTGSPEDPTSQRREALRARHADAGAPTTCPLQMRRARPTKRCAVSPLLRQGCLPVLGRRITPRCRTPILAHRIHVWSVYSINPPPSTTVWLWLALATVSTSWTTGREIKEVNQPACQAEAGSRHEPRRRSGVCRCCCCRGAEPRQKGESEHRNKHKSRGSCCSTAPTGHCCW
jgi:hypothetical protein